MTLADSLRAADYVLATLQVDHLWLLQEGIGASQEIRERMQQIEFVHREVIALGKAAAIHPDGFARFAASGGAANPPSVN